MREATPLSRSCSKFPSMCILPHHVKATENIIQVVLEGLHSPSFSPGSGGKGTALNVYRLLLVQALFHIGKILIL